MKLKFLGASKTVTGSKYLIETEEKKILVDCGLFQGFKKLRLRNWEPFPEPADKIDSVVLTHAHIDHSGYLPILVRSGFKGPIYATPATRDLCEILLRDSGRIQEEDARRANKYRYSKHKPALPLYTEEEAVIALQQFKTVSYQKQHDLGNGLTLQLSRAGHILGSAILTFRMDETILAFSGDLGRPNHPIMKDPAKIENADYLILEATYGGRLHSTESALEELGEIIRTTSQRGGKVIIPSFAVGRSQIILYLIHQLKKTSAIPDIPIFLDSPMAQNATDIMLKHGSEHRLAPDLCSEVCGIAHYVRSAKESKLLHTSPMPAVIISASGMVEGGRVLHHIKHFGPDPKSTIVFAGFQASMTRGDRILRGEKEVKIHGKMVPIRAKVEILESLSSHADYKEVLEWLGSLKKPPRKVFLVHGEPESCQSLKEKIEGQFGWNVGVPDYLDEVDL